MYLSSALCLDAPVMRAPEVRKYSEKWHDQEKKFKEKWAARDKKMGLEDLSTVVLKKKLAPGTFTVCSHLGTSHL